MSDDASVGQAGPPGLGPGFSRPQPWPSPASGLLRLLLLVWPPKDTWPAFLHIVGPGGGLPTGSPGPLAAGSPAGCWPVLCPGSSPPAPRWPLAGAQRRPRWHRRRALSRVAAARVTPPLTGLLPPPVAGVALHARVPRTPGHGPGHGHGERSLRGHPHPRVPLAVSSATPLQGPPGAGCRGHSGASFQFSARQRPMARAGAADTEPFAGPQRPRGAVPEGPAVHVHTRRQRCLPCQTSACGPAALVPNTAVTFRRQATRGGAARGPPAPGPAAPGTRQCRPRARPRLLGVHRGKATRPRGRPAPQCPGRCWRPPGPHPAHRLRPGPRPARPCFASSPFRGAPRDSPWLGSAGGRQRPGGPRGRACSVLLGGSTCSLASRPLAGSGRPSPRVRTAPGGAGRPS